MNIAIIPARGGSKRIPRKNIKDFCGRPVIAYSIDAALSCGLFERVIVSTDDADIASVARRYGAETPFLRPAELSGDFTATADVVIHAIEWLKTGGFSPENVCCIYATAPFITSELLRNSFDKLKTSCATAVFPVTTFPACIFRALKIGDDGRLAMIWPEHELARSNDLPVAYHDAGQFYWLDCGRFMEEKRIYSRDSAPVILPRYLVQDLDTTEDWATAERMFETLRMKGRMYDL
ncbi:MAG: pseudaminic acid cytidylyltransferase [Desulfobacteraceae bacterium]|nr:pseudaminic acid cytidylyltransferase [Desulfobacteraceae bacterium]